MDIIQLSRDLMQKQTQINKAPAWRLTQLAIAKGRELAEKYHEDERLILTSLYLAHTVFSPIWGGEIQQKHPFLSAEFSKKYLEEWKVPEVEQKIILNSIQAHHGAVETESQIAEIVKNAECFKFVTMEGALIYLHEWGKRQVDYEEARDKVLQKMEQKKKLLTLEECIQEADKNCQQIRKIFQGRME